MATKRLHYIDWLRVLAVLLLFPFHTSRVFNFGESFYIKSAQLSHEINYAIGFVDRWHMPLLFLLAGASTYLALSKRSVGQYASERGLRLGVPLLFGILALLPPQTFIGARFNSGYTASFWTYLSTGSFLRWNIRDGGDYYGGLGIGHLWFILFLLAIAMICLPFIAWGRSERGRERIRAWACALGRPAWWLLPPLVLFFAEAAPDLFGKKIVYYLAFFVLGFIVIADERFAERAQRWMVLELALGTVLCAAYVGIFRWRDALPDPSAPLAAVNYLGMLGVWAMLLGMLGAGRRFLDRDSRALSYLAEGSYPVYILHQTAIVVVAALIVQLPVAGPMQWVAILAASVAVTFAAYELLRRIPPLRFLFGMRPLPARSPAQ